jgi:hypothetical protein
MSNQRGAGGREINAKKELKELIQKKMIRKIGKGKNIYYALVTD